MRIVSPRAEARLGDAKTAIVAGHFTGGEGRRGGVQGSGGVKGFEEGVISFSPLFSAATVRGFLLSSTAIQVPSWFTSRISNDQPSKVDLGRGSASPLAAAASCLWSFGSEDIPPSIAADISSLKGHPTGMNRWKGDARKPVEIPETVGGKADSADSSFGSTLSKKSKSDFKLRANQAFKSESKDNFRISTFKQSMSQNNEAGSPMDVQRDRDLRKQANVGSGEPLFPEKQVFIPQKGEPEKPLPLEPLFDMHQIRSIILSQEAEFREQVRELHRLHRIQTLLMAEMRRKDSDFMAHPPRTDIGGPSQSPAAFPLNSGLGNSQRGPGSSNTGNEYEASIVMPEFLKGGSTFRQRDSPLTSPPQEVNLFKHSARVPPARRTFDLERPPDEDDDEQPDRKEMDMHKPDGNCIKSIESPESCTNEPEPESDMFSLNLSTGWSRGKSAKDDSEQSNKAEYEISRAAKRPREEAALFPFLAIKSESLREAPVRPTPTMASQTFLGGLWGLQLGGKLDIPSAPDGNRSPDDSEAPKKKERLSLNLEVEEKEMPATSASNGAPHWLLKAPAAKSPKKTLCQTESSSLNFQDSFSPPRNSSEQGMMKASPQGRGETGSGSTPGMVWESERRISEDPPRNRSQSSNNAPEMSEDNMHAGARGAHQVQFSVGPAANERARNGPVKPAQGVGEALTLYPSWREGGEVPANSLPHGVFTQSLPIAGGYGVQLRSFDGPGLAAQGLLHVGHAVNMGTGSTQFAPECGPGMWFQQANSDFQYQQFQQQQQLAASRQTGVVSSSRQGGGPWQQAPMKISQGGGYGQGAVFAIPAATGPPLGFPLYGVQKVGEDLPGPNWTPGNVGPPFRPFSIVVPPKPPFKRPPKLVLTHDGATMELKVVSPDREVGAKVITEKSFSGSSDEELSEKKDLALNQGRGQQDERDVSMQSSGRRDGDKRANSITGIMKEKDHPPASGGDWMAKVSSAAAHRNSQSGRMQNASATLLPLAQDEGMDDADGGSSDAGSGGSGVGDVINPGEGASPPAPMATFVRGGSKRNLPAGEGEEGINMGELGLQADSDSQSGRLDRKDKPSKHQESHQEQLSASLSLRSSLSTIARRISRGSSDGPGHVVDNNNNMQKSARRTDGSPEEGERRAAPAFHHVLEQSGSSTGGIMNLLVKEIQSHGLCKQQQNTDELRNAQLELQQPSCSTSQSRVVHTSKLEDSENHQQGTTKESSKGTESSTSGLGVKVSREQHRGRVAMDIDETERGTNHVGQRNTSFANFGDVSKQERESKTGHSKQLSGANTSSEKDGVQHKPYSPVLRQVSSPSSMVDMERHAEGSSKKVSQASETDQGNGRSPRRTTECIGSSTSIEQDHLCSPGGIDSSCEEVDGTLTSCNDSSLTWSELEEEVQRRTW
ncbi:unnamed protein product [Calypogeia fissa]